MVIFKELHKKIPVLYHTTEQGSTHIKIKTT